MSLDRIIAAATTPAEKGGHSQLYEWYWMQYDLLAPALLPPRTPNWSLIAAEFAIMAKQGEPVCDGGGQPPRLNTCRQTWWKVVRDKKRMEAVIVGLLVTPTQLAANPLKATSRFGPTPLLPGVVLDDDPLPEFEFKFAGGLKDWTKKSDPP